nr:unnamed protein product [Digitaria exilis]
MQEALPSWTGEMPPLGHRLELPPLGHRLELPLQTIGAVAAAGSPSGCRRSHRLEPPLPPSVVMRSPEGFWVAVVKGQREQFWASAHRREPSR